MKCPICRYEMKVTDWIKSDYFCDRCNHKNIFIESKINRLESKDCAKVMKEFNLRVIDNIYSPIDISADEANVIYLIASLID